MNTITKLFLALSVVIFMFASCGGNNSSNLQAYQAHQAQIEKQKQRAFAELDKQ